MSTIKEIEDAIRQLPDDDLAALRAWFAEFDAAIDSSCEAARRSIGS